MKRLFITSVFLTLPISAYAADLYSPPPAASYDDAPAAADDFNWMGFYGGLNAGYLWGEGRIFITVGNNDEGSDTYDLNGFIGGGQIGYNFQNGPWVLGVEADFQYSDVSGSTSANCPGGCTSDLEWFGTVRGRVGYAFDNLLVYATGGWAYGKVEDSILALPLNSSETLTGGWTAGGGLEYGFMHNWTAKIEYLYMDLGNSDTGPPTNVGGRYDENHIVRVGVNYLFN